MRHDAVTNVSSSVAATPSTMPVVVLRFHTCEPTGDSLRDILTYLSRKETALNSFTIASERRPRVRTAKPSEMQSVSDYLLFFGSACQPDIWSTVTLAIPATPVSGEARVSSMARVGEPRGPIFWIHW